MTGSLGIGNLRRGESEGMVRKLMAIIEGISKSEDSRGEEESESSEKERDGSVLGSEGKTVGGGEGVCQKNRGWLAVLF